MLGSTWPTINKPDFTGPIKRYLEENGYGNYMMEYLSTGFIPGDGIWYKCYSNFQVAEDRVEYYNL